ncbi:recombinase family protein [Rhizobium sp. R693]|uniref:recombinase family protein n=1 Tax=Rhizobium sp. R693 TaxID=1764276 RepID=UPI001FDA96D9|nr:recombinase family protein [Rhizobium sp. R693]
MLRSLRPGDTLIVWRLDRLGRSIRELIQIIEKLGRRKIDFISLFQLVMIAEQLP